jgi:hypothetical protein
LTLASVNQRRHHHPRRDILILFIARSHPDRRATPRHLTKQQIAEAIAQLD